MLWRRAQALVAAAALFTAVSVSQAANDCPFISDAKKGWLRATNSKTGLCNQLIGVLSYIPVATLFKLNLIVGPMFSRVSFHDGFDQMIATIRPMPLSYFFDWNHYTNNAYSDRNSGIDIIVEEAEVDRHCGVDYTANHTFFVEKRFWPFSPHDLMDLVVKEKNVSLPRPRGSILQLGSDLVSTYDFRTLPDRSYANLQLEGLSKLNSSLQQVFGAIMSTLPAHFIAVHVRLEQDILSPEWAEQNHTNFNVLVRQYIDRLRNYLQEHVPDSRQKSELKVVYLSSGIFQPVELNKNEDRPEKDDSSSSSSLYRANTVAAAFQSAGFLPVWNARVLSKEFLSTLPKLSSSSRHRILLARSLWDSLGAEQRALIDLFVCKSADHFLPAQIGSSFGYLTIRWRALERKTDPKETEALVDTAPGEMKLFKEWGFRH